MENQTFVCQFPDLFRALRERGIAAGDPDKSPVELVQARSPRSKPFKERTQLFFHDVDFTVMGRVNFDPVDDVRPAIYRIVSHCVVPLTFSPTPRFQALLEVHATSNGSWIVCGDTPTVVTQRLKARLPGTLKVMGLLDSLAERYRFSRLLALATAIATAVFARPLNSLRPPHPSSPASSPSTSRAEMSLVLPVSGSK